MSSPASSANCPICHKTSSRSTDIPRHFDERHTPKKQCLHCSSAFGRTGRMWEHLVEKHQFTKQQAQLIYPKMTTVKMEQLLQEGRSLSSRTGRSLATPPQSAAGYELQPNTGFYHQNQFQVNDIFSDVRRTPNSTARVVPMPPPQSNPQYMTAFPQFQNESSSNVRLHQDAPQHLGAGGNTAAQWSTNLSTIPSAVFPPFQVASAAIAAPENQSQREEGSQSQQMFVNMSSLHQPQRHSTAAPHVVPSASRIVRRMSYSVREASQFPDSSSSSNNNSNNNSNNANNLGFNQPSQRRREAPRGIHDMASMYPIGQFPSPNIPPNEGFPSAIRDPRATSSRASEDFSNMSSNATYSQTTHQHHGLQRFAAQGNNIPNPSMHISESRVRCRCYSISGTGLVGCEVCRPRT